ncbi:hypothetical protein SKAU_G00190010 [Synaphobranchus kaupii]|uniref:Tetratricopeptide repeat protein 32 n=1 Tax=Synaphobranchus kaupii TaxID=118154 RepID=A0A9Q1FDI0_SYNKA|nr:hypothetical protein SKAU_G00190010 [Synaphobranchus kaupii]
MGRLGNDDDSIYVRWVVAGTSVTALINTGSTIRLIKMGLLAQKAAWFHYSLECQRSFNSLCAALVSAPTLSMVDPSNPSYWIQCVCIQYEGFDESTMERRTWKTSLLVLENAHIEFNKKQLIRLRICIQSSSHVVKQENDPRDLAIAFNNRGQIKYRQVDFYQAMEDYTLAIQANSRFEVPFYNRGLIRYRLGFFQEAEEDFQKTLDLNPTFEDAKLSLKQAIIDRKHRINRGY